MKKVENNMVSMDWDANGFIETKKQGFISAVHEYSGVAVAFRDGKVYTHIDDDGKAVSFKDLVGTIKQAVKDKDRDYPAFYDDYAELFDGEVFSDSTLTHLGLVDFKEDMKDRLEDLSGYWMVEETWLA